MTEVVELEIALLEDRLLHLKAQTRCREHSRGCCSEVEARLPQGHTQRFSRQMIVPGFGAGSQEVLQQLRVLVIGAGGLGCPSGLYLASAGVGHIGVVDDDDVETSNLHRQVAHPSRRCGWSKAKSLVATLAAIAPSATTFEAVRARFDARIARSLVQSYHVVVDCSDNPATRYLASDACGLARKPLVSGAALGTDGQLSTYLFRGAPCYRCLHPKPPPPATVSSCADAGVLGPITGVIGSMQALEVLKIAADCAAAGLRPRMRLRRAGAAATVAAGAPDGDRSPSGSAGSGVCGGGAGAGAAESSQAAEAMFARCSCAGGSTAHAAGCDLRCGCGDDAAACPCPPVDVCSAEAFVADRLAGRSAGASGTDCSAAGGAVAGAGTVASTAAAASESEPAHGFGSALAGRLFVFDGADGRARTVALRPRRADCAVCAACTSATAAGVASGSDAAATSTPSSAAAPATSGGAGSVASIRSLEDTDAWLRSHGLIAREGAAAAPAFASATAFSADGTPSSAPALLRGPVAAEAACACESKPTADISAPVPDVSVEELAEARRRRDQSGGYASGGPATAGEAGPLVVDVRSREQFSICSLRGSVNIPLAELRRDVSSSLRSAGIDITASWGDPRVYVLCRRGVDSKTGAAILRGLGLDAVNVAGGLQAWTSRVDSTFPRY